MRISHILPQYSDCWQMIATKPVLFHKIISPTDSLPLEYLRELSARREALTRKSAYLLGNPDAGDEENRGKDFVHWWVSESPAWSSLHSPALPSHMPILPDPLPPRLVQAAPVHGVV
jgi:hypothetical protein